MENCYNIGDIIIKEGFSQENVGGIIGLNGYSVETFSSPTNSYCTEDTEYAYYYWNEENLIPSTEGKIPKENLKTYATILGNAFKEDEYIINNGYPILKWENNQNNNNGLL